MPGGADGKGAEVARERREREEDGGNSAWSPPPFEEDVEIMGIQPIFDEGSPTLRRIFWALVVLSGIGFAVYQIVTQIDVYFTYPTSASVDISSVPELAFPRVGVCNRNRIMASKLPEEANSSASSIDGVFPQSMLVGDWRENYTYLAHQRDETLLSCTYNNEACSEADISLAPSSQGMCNVFNIDGTVRSRNKGDNFGLSLLLDTQLDEYITATDDAGFKIHVDEHIHLMLGGTPIVPGGSTVVRITYSSINYLPDPWGTCGNTTLTDFAYYTTSSCKVECETTYVVEQCGCQMMHMNRSGAPVCNPVEEAGCAQDALDQFTTLGSPCEIDCLNSCEQALYLYTMYQGSFSDAYLDRIAKQYGKDAAYWKQNLIKLNVYFDHLVQEVVTHQPIYDVSALLCDLGGALGLILGASIITVLELLDFLLLQMVYRKQHCTVHHQRPQTVIVDMETTK